MQVTGPECYTRLLDVKKTTAFVRAQGMSEKDCAALTIEFVERVAKRGSHKTACGRYNPISHTISLATYEIPEPFDALPPRGQDLYLEDLNGTLLHELRHAIGRRRVREWAPSLLFLLLFGLMPLLLDLFLLGQTFFFWPVLLLIYLVATRVLYRLSYMEYLARAFERRYSGDTPLLARETTGETQGNEGGEQTL